MIFWSAAFVVDTAIGSLSVCFSNFCSSWWEKSVIVNRTHQTHHSSSV